MAIIRGDGGDNMLEGTPVRDTIHRTLSWYAERGLGPAPLG